MNPRTTARYHVALVLRRATLLVPGALLALGTATTAPAQVAAATPPPIASLDSAWGAMSRSYWDTLLVQGAWRATYDSIRASLDSTADDDVVRHAIRALMAVPRQSHFALIPASAAPPPAAPGATRDAAPRRPGTTGLLVRSVGDTVVVWRIAAGSAAERAGIQPGDMILAVNNVAIDSARAHMSRESGVDSIAVRRLVTTAVLSRLGGNAGDSVRVALRDASGGERTHVLVREPMRGRLSQFGNLPPIIASVTRDSLPLGNGRHATLLAVSSWFPAISPDLDALLFGARGTSGLIIDLRGNPGGVIGMVAGVSGHMLDTAIALGTMRGRGATIRFVANPRLVDRSGNRVGIIAAPIAILIDEFSASTSEFFAAGMQGIGRARIFGERSAGMSLPALMSRLPNGDVLMHAIADHEDAAGRRIEGVGVIPDELVPLRRVDLRTGRDAPLEAARAWIAAQLP